MKAQPKESYLLRWITLFAVAGNIFFNYYINAYPINGQTMGDVSARHPTLFTPAGYAFSIWGIIYLSLIVYCVYQVLPSQRNKPLFGQLAPPLIYTSLLSVLWLISFSYELFDSSVVIITAMLLTAVVLYGTAKEAVFAQTANGWITLPFSLYMGWLSVAIIANTSVFLKDLGWEGGAWGETLWTVIMLSIALVLAIIISWRFRDIVYPLVFAWATVAIYVARENTNASVALAAISSASIAGVWVFGYGIWLLSKPQHQTAV